jgi:hypothetical protein
MFCRWQTEKERNVRIYEYRKVGFQELKKPGDKKKRKQIWNCGF